MSLHGHAKIELTNVKTGEVQTVEEDNMFTNALSDIFASPSASRAIYSGNAQSIGGLLPLQETAIGGILCLKSPREEDPNKYEMPFNEDEITGYASYNTNSTTDIFRGSRNLTESKKIKNGYQLVWDFSTSQGNGLISCICLTHYKRGLSKYGNSIAIDHSADSGGQTASTIGGNTDIFSKRVSYDISKSILTRIENSSLNTIKIQKYFLPITGLTQKHLVDSEYYDYASESSRNVYQAPPRLISEKTITLSKEILDTSNYLWLENPDDNYFYNFSISNKKFRLIRINKKTYLTDEEYFVEKEDTNFPTLRMVSSVPEISGFIYHNNLFIASSNTYQDKNSLYGYRAYKFSLEDLTNITPQEISNISLFGYSFEVSPLYIKNYDCVLTHDYIYYEDLEKGKIFAYPRVGFLNSDSDYKYILLGCDKGEFLLYLICYAQYAPRFYYGFRTLNYYLATINNLETPITKTPDQSMKITYTITEVEDEQ